MSLSSTVLVSDACWRTYAARCGGRFETRVGASVRNPDEAAHLSGVMPPALPK